MKLFDFLKQAQEKADALQKKADTITEQLKNGQITTLSEMLKPVPQKRDVSNEDISRQILRQRDGLLKNGFTEYEYVANRDCCAFCAALNRKHFPISSLKIGVNAPPMHDGCRCSISSYADDREYESWLNFLANGGTTAEWEKAKKKKK
jgi:SPP1 gp7 family putative phage head morphogenesis protein